MSDAGKVQVPGTSSRARRFLADVSVYSGASYFCQALNTIRGLVVAGTLPAADLGVWRLIQVILQYTVLADIGVGVGALREVAYHNGRGERRDADRAARTGFIASLAVALALLLILSGASLVAWAGGEERWALALGVCAVLAALWQVFTYLDLQYMGIKRFGVKSVIQVAWSVLFLLGVIVFAVRWELMGVYLAALVAYLALAALSLAWFPQRFPPEFHRPTLRRMVVTGYPVNLGYLSWTMLRTTDQILVMAVLGSVGMGIYGLAVMLMNMLHLLANSISQVVSPWVIELYGRNRRIDDTLPFMRKATEGLSWLGAVGMGVSMLLVDLPVRLWMPHYEGAIPVARILFAGAFFLALPQGVASFFLAIERLFPLIGLQVASSAVLAAAGGAALAMGWGLPGVAAAATGTFAVYSALHLFLVFRVHGRMAGFWIWYAKLMIPLLLTVLLVLLAGRIRIWDGGRWEGDLLNAGLRTLVLGLLLAWPVFRKVRAILRR